MRIQRVVLEHHRDIACFGWNVIHSFAVDQQIAAADLLKPGNHTQGGRFTAARRADKYDELFIGNFQVEVLHHMHLVIVDLLNML